MKDDASNKFLAQHSQTNLSAEVFPSDHCQYDTGVWPSFQTQQDLENDVWWSEYFTVVYGAVPTWGYPICTGAFQFLWQNAAKHAGVVQASFTDCAPTTTHGAGTELIEGTYYVGHSFDEARDAYGFIYNSNLLGVYAPANAWVEVTRTVFPGDVGAMWFYMSIGSGVYVYTGNTYVWDDHPQAVMDMLGRRCSDQSYDTFSSIATECENDFDDLFVAAKNMDVSTIQFTNHYDCTCGPQGTSSYKFNRHCMTEIIALADASHAGSGCSNLMKGGWEASASCNCQDKFVSSTKAGFSVAYANCGIS